MADYAHQEIYKMIDNIKSGKLILPAIQRNFVWPEDKICALFDSLMHDYPIGTFLFWFIDKETVENYTFNSFISKYDEQKGSNQRGDKVIASRDEYIGVLDGQQRITSLYLGLCGSRRTRLKGKKKDLDSSYVEKYLCIDLLDVPTDEENEYRFQFKEEPEIKVLITDPDPEIKDEFWVKVADVYNKDFNAADYMDDVDEQYFGKSMPFSDKKPARQMLEALYNAIFVRSNVNYYPAESKELAEVVDIFVRVNSGGQKLSASDLMLSIATGEKEDEDIHVKMREAINAIYSATGGNDDTSFVADKELILIAGLMFTGADSMSLQKKENYSRARIHEILDNWDAIIDALCLAAKFIDSLGFVGKKLTSKNLILPVAYYFFKNPTIDEGHITSHTIRARRDRIYIRQWLLRAMINSIFRDGTGSTLKFIRNVIDNKKTDHFPLNYLMEPEQKQKRSLKITDDTIEEILDYKYQDVRVVPLLLELTKGHYKNDYQVDHIWPKATLESMKELKRLLPTSDESERRRYRDNCNKLGNLELLSSSENASKSGILFHQWIEQEFKEDPENSYFEINLIPKDISYNFDNFEIFLEKRNELLKRAIEKALPKDFDAIAQRYGLQ